MAAGPRSCAPGVDRFQAVRHAWRRAPSRCAAGRAGGARAGSAGRRRTSGAQPDQAEHGRLRLPPDGLLALNLDIPAARYPDVGAQSRFYERLLDRVRALPGVAAASTTSGAPASGRATTFSFAIEGRPAATPSGREDPVPLRAVMPDYFRTLGIPVLRGRTIEPTDRQDAPPVVVFNESLAKRFWKSGDERGRPPRQLRRSGGAVVRDRRRRRRYAGRRPRSAGPAGGLRAVRTTAGTVGMAHVADAGRAGAPGFGAGGSCSVHPLRAERDRSDTAAADRSGPSPSCTPRTPRAAGSRCS